MKIITSIRSATCVASIAIIAPMSVQAEEFINILTGGTSGVYYPIGVALSEIYADTIPDVRTQVQSTKASVENLNLIQQGKGEIALALGDSVKYAAEGNADAGFEQPLEKLRGVAAAYPNYIQIAASQDSGIASLNDISGKTMSVGAPKSGTELNARAILAAANLSYDDLSKVEYLPFAESVELLKNRQIDATLQSAGLGVASLKDLSVSMPITIVPVDASIVESLGAPYFVGTIPAGTYEGQEADVTTAAVPNFFVTSADLDEELVYQMTKQMFENLDRLQAAHAAANGISLETATTGMPIPLHPGAERYYKEVGVIQ